MISIQLTNNTYNQQNYLLNLKKLEKSIIFNKLKIINIKSPIYLKLVGFIEELNKTTNLNYLIVKKINYNLLLPHYLPV